METESSSSLISGAPSGGAWETITSHQKFAGWVASTLVPGATFKIKLAYIKAVFQSVHGFLGAKSVSKDNSLKTAFLVELISFICLATLKIAKSLVISESGSLFAAVVLCDMPLGISIADIKTALGTFRSVTCVVLKPAGIWQYVVIYFEKLDSTVSALNHWSVLVSKDSVRILSLAKLVNLLPGCTVFKISDIISQVGGWTCFIPRSSDSGHHSQFALVKFGSQVDLDSAVVKTDYKSTETKHPQKYIKVATIETIGKDHSSYGKALFQYFRKDLGIPARTAYAESDFCNYINAKIDCLLGRTTDTRRLGEQIHQSLLGYSTAMITRAIAETLHIIDTDIKYYVAQQFSQVQQPVESDPKEYENKFNNPITAQAKFTVNKKPRVLSPTTLSYHQTPQSRIVFNPPPETHWTKSLGEYGLLFGNLTPAAGQTEENPSTWEQPSAQNLAELASPLTEKTAILQPIGSSNKGKQSALAPGEHLNTQTPIPLNITSNTPPINRIMAYQDIAKLKKFSAIERDYYTMVQVLNQFIKRLWNSILRSIKLCHLTSLQDTITLARDFESAEQEVNHIQAINLAINRTSNINAKITQLSEKLTQKIKGFLAGTTETYQPPQQKENNNNNRYPQQQNHQQQQQPWRSDLHNCYYCQKPEHIAHDCRRKIMDQNQGNPYQQPRYQQNMVPQYSIPQNQPSLYAQQVPYTQLLLQNYYQPPPITQAISHYQTSPYSPFRPQAIDYNQGWRNPNNNQVQTNSRLSRPIPRSPAQSRPTPTGYLNQAFYFGLMENQADGNTKTPIGEIDNFPFEINGIQISTKNTQKLQLTFNGQHAQVPATCGHFKNQCTEESLIEFEDTLMPPIIKTYQVSWVDDYQTELPPPPTWEEKGKGRAEKKPQLSSLGYITSDQRNLFYQPPRLICINCAKKLSTMDACIRNNKEWPTATKYYCRLCKWNHMLCFACGKILPDEELWNDVSGRGGTCNEACQYTILINNWVQKETPIEDAWK
ncbi:hypothetical protein G9A89_017223 [Geosiphon pyriformis]|nr:hypothetical protein G9A89_017223 [Geosiphon pyriformis]